MRKTLPKQSVEITGETFALAEAIFRDSQTSALPCTSMSEVLQQAVAVYWDWYLEHAAKNPDELLTVVWDLHKFEQTDTTRYYRQSQPKQDLKADRGNDR